MSESGQTAEPASVRNETCAFFVSAQDDRALALVDSLAAQDSDFLADNEAVQHDFAALDREVDAMVVWR